LKDVKKLQENKAMRHLEDTKTDVLVEQLKEFWQDQARFNNPSLYREPVDGHYPADLYFDRQTADADQQAHPDDFYYQAQGVEPPQRTQGRGLSLRSIICWVLFWVAVGEIVLLFWPVV
jgi:hypothetical protein